MSDTTTDPYALARDAADALRERTGVETHDVALVMGSGWVPAADLLGETVAEIPVTDLPGFHAAGGRRATPAPCGRWPPATGARWSSSGAPTSTRAAAWPRSCTAYAPPPPPAPAWSCSPTAAAGCARRTRAGPAGADQRPHQPDGHLADRRRDVRRPHRPLLAAAARAVPRGRPVARRGRLRPVPRPALRDAGRDRAWSGRSAATWSGMSTTLEAIAAREAGAEVLGISLVTNLAAGHDRRAAQPRGGPRGRPRGGRRGWATLSQVVDAAVSAHGLQPGQGHEHRGSADTVDAVDRRRGVARRGPRPGHPGRAAGAARRPATPRALADRFGARLEFGTAGLRGALGAGPNRMNRVVVIRAAAGLAAYIEGARRQGGRRRLRRAAQVRRVRPRHRRGDDGRRAARVGAPPAAADPGARVRDPPPRRRRRCHGHRVAQPAAGQRLQGLPRRRLADRPAGRRRDLGRDRGGRPARRRPARGRLGDPRRRRARRVPRPGRRRSSTRPHPATCASSTPRCTAWAATWCWRPSSAPASRRPPW